MRGRAYSTCEGGQGGGAAAATGLVESGKIGGGLNLNGDVDVGEINLSEMNPEDIRVSYPTAYYETDAQFCLCVDIRANSCAQLHISTSRC